MTNENFDDMPLEERVARQAEAAQQGAQDQRGQQADGGHQGQGGQQDRQGGQGEVIGAGAGGGNGQQGLIKDPEDWATGDQPMTDAQRSYLDSLAKQAGETLPADLTKAEASEHIDRLQQATGRGSGTNADGAGQDRSPRS